MALNEIKTVGTLERKTSGWPAIEYAPSGSGPPRADSWQSCASWRDLPRGSTWLVRRPGEATALFRVALPIVPSVASSAPQTVSAELAPSGGALPDDIKEALATIQEGTLRVAQLMGTVTSSAEKVASLVRADNDTQQQLAEALAALQKDRQSAAVINHTIKYVDLLLGGAAVKLGLLPVDQWPSGREMLELYSTVKGYGMTLAEVKTLLGGYAASKDKEG